MKKIEIIPAVMPEDYDDLVDKVTAVAHLVPTVQIDVMDGNFVPSVSWPYGDASHFEEIQKETEGLPHWEDVNFSIDLMVADPQTEVQKWIHAGADEVIIHVESLDENNIAWLKELKESGVVHICLALSPLTANSVLDTYKDMYDSVQFMGIENVGYQGEPFMESVLTKIADFRAAHPDMPIMIDGGVNFENLEDLVEAGVTRIVSGSVIFESGDIRETVKEMKKIAENL